MGRPIRDTPMPTYDYICTACKHEFEEFQSMTAKVLKKCPECGKNTLERKIGIGAGVLFKGGGFYETDYRSDSYKKAADADKPGSDKPADKTDKKDAAPAAAPKPATESASKTTDGPSTAARPGPAPKPSAPSAAKRLKSKKR